MGKQSRPLAGKFVAQIYIKKKLDYGALKLDLLINSIRTVSAKYVISHICDKYSGNYETIKLNPFMIRVANWSRWLSLISVVLSK